MFARDLALLVTGDVRSPQNCADVCMTLMAGSGKPDWFEKCVDIRIVAKERQHGKQL